MKSKKMWLARNVLFGALVASAVSPAWADGEFPFGLEMTLDAQQLPGAKHPPTVEIGENGEAKLDLWCKSGRGQFSVAGETVIFMPGPLADGGCAPQLAQADDALVSSLSAAQNWKRQGDLVSFIGPATVRFRLNTN